MGRFRSGWLGWLGVVVPALWPCAGGASTYSSLQRIGEVEHPWCLQLHIHGPLSEQNGSLDWHVRKAHEIGVDVLWWTDHDWRTDLLGFTAGFDFENCTYSTTLHKWVEPDGYEERYFETTYASPYTQVAVSTARASQGTKSFRIEVADPGFSGGQRIELAQTTSRRQNVYGLATSPRLRLALFPETFDPANDKFVVQVKLCEHSDGWPTLRYVAGTLDGEAADAIVLPVVTGQWNELLLDVAGDAWARFANGGTDSVRAQDNNLFDVRVSLNTRNGQTAVVYLDDLRYLANGTLAGTGLLDWQRTASAYYEGQDQTVKHFVGSELSRFKIQQHMNAYAPNLVPVDYTGHVAADSLWYCVEQVHAQGGLVSFNHPWGVGIYGNPAETQEQKALRILKAKRDALATNLYDCDMLEVGYRIRHGINLAGHLDLWDCLTANARFVTGLGVTDTHGSAWSIGWVPWQPSALYENNYVTWVWAPSRDEVPLLDALAAGRAWFGDPYRWRGEMELATPDGFPMGRVVLTDKPQHPVVIRVTNLPATAEVRLRQAEILDDGRSATDVHWLRTETLAAPVVDGVFRDSIDVDTTVPSFVRIEVENEGLEWSFSNPLCFVRRVPPRGIDAHRLGASLDAVRITGAAALVLRDAAYSATSGQLTLVLDENTPGLGRLTLDATSLGAPSWVTGVNTWDYDVGILSLYGFAGVGSPVTVAWAGPVATPTIAATPRELALTATRPNPFRGALEVEYTLPNAAAALIEVLDVTGRRIRVLQDEWTPAGRHVARWDGTDPGGKAVADGVYLVRLRASGDVRSTKVVKVR